MKKLSCIVVLLLVIEALFGQDIIYLKDGTNIKTKIIEITTQAIKYKRSDQLDGPLRNLSKSEVFMIIYEDGTREVIKNDIPENVVPTQRTIDPLPMYESQKVNVAPSYQDLCFQGQQDASRYFTGYREAATWTGVATILGGGLIGLIPAIACSSSAPSPMNFTVPDADLLQNSTYYQCYSQEAKRIKSKKVWTNFGIGVAVNVAVAYLILSLSDY